MTGPRPEQYTPEELTQILQNALRALRQNPQDAEALEAVKLANEMLNAHERPMIEAGERTTAGGWGKPVEAVKGTLEGIASGVVAPIALAHTAATQGISPAVDQMIEGITSLPGEIMSGDPRRISRVSGGIAGSGLWGPALRGAARPIGELAKRPGLKNAQIAAQTAALEDLVSQRAAKAPLQVEKLSQDVGMGPLRRTALEELVAERQAMAEPKLTAQELANRQKAQQITRGEAEGPARLAALEERLAQSMEKHGPTLENIQLRNELLKARLDALAAEGAEGAMGAEAAMPSVLENLLTETMAKRPSAKAPKPKAKSPLEEMEIPTKIGKQPSQQAQKHVDKTRSAMDKANKKKK